MLLPIEHSRLSLDAVRQQLSENPIQIPMNLITLKATLKSSRYTRSVGGTLASMDVLFCVSPNPDDGTNLVTFDSRSRLRK